MKLAHLRTDLLKALINLSDCSFGFRMNGKQNTFMQYCFGFLQIMKLEIDEIAAPRSFIFLWCGSGEGLDLGRVVRLKSLKIDVILSFVS